MSSFLPSFASDISLLPASVSAAAVSRRKLLLQVCREQQQQQLLAVLFPDFVRCFFSFPSSCAVSQCSSPPPRCCISFCALNLPAAGAASVFSIPFPTTPTTSAAAVTAPFHMKLQPTSKSIGSQCVASSSAATAAFKKSVDLSACRAFNAGGAAACMCVVACAKQSRTIGVSCEKAAHFRSCIVGSNATVFEKNRKDAASVAAAKTTIFTTTCVQPQIAYWRHQQQQQHASNFRCLRSSSSVPFFVSQPQQLQLPQKAQRDQLQQQKQPPETEETGREETEVWKRASCLLPEVTLLQSNVGAAVATELDLFPLFHFFLHRLSLKALLSAAAAPFLFQQKQLRQHRAAAAAALGGDKIVVVDNSNNVLSTMMTTKTSDDSNSLRHPNRSSSPSRGKGAVFGAATFGALLLLLPPAAAAAIFTAAKLAAFLSSAACASAVGTTSLFSAAAAAPTAAGSAVSLPAAAAAAAAALAGGFFSSSSSCFGVSAWSPTTTAVVSRALRFFLFFAKTTKSSFAGALHHHSAAAAAVVPAQQQTATASSSSQALTACAVSAASFRSFWWCCTAPGGAVKKNTTKTKNATVSSNAKSFHDFFSLASSSLPNKTLFAMLPQSLPPQLDTFSRAFLWPASTATVTAAAFLSTAAVTVAAAAASLSAAATVNQSLAGFLQDLWINFWKGNRWKGPQKNKWKWYHRHGYWATRKKLIDFTKFRRYGYHERYGMGRPKIKFWEDPSRHKRLRQSVRFW